MNAPDDGKPPAVRERVPLCHWCAWKIVLPFDMEPRPLRGAERCYSCGATED